MNELYSVDYAGTISQVSWDIGQLRAFLCSDPTQTKAMIRNPDEINGKLAII